MKRTWLPVAVGLLTAAGCSSDAPAPNVSDDDDGTQLSPAAISQIESLIAAKAQRTPAQRKISSALLYAKSGRFADALAETKDPGKRIESLNQVDAKGRVLVDIKGNMAALNGRIEALGGAVVNLRQRSARAWVSLDRVEELASEAAVQSVQPAYQATTWRTDKPGGDPKYRTGTRAERIAAVGKAQEALRSRAAQPTATTAIEGGVTINAGSKNSEGDRAHAADRARRFFGTDGTGVKIGVLSDSDDFKEASIASGDLPANTVTVPGQDGRPGSGEGTAMMEIVHDVAPGAQLFFATAFNSPEEFADNIRRLRFEFNNDIIIDDVIYFFESPFQDDIIAQAVADVTADGAQYFSSAGNGGNNDDGTSGTWEGDFKPAGALATLPSGYTVHSFGGGVIANRIEAAGGPLILHWSDPGSLANPASSNDYDLFVLDNALRTVAVASTDVQNGAELPFEFLGFNIPAGFRVVIAASPGAELRAVRTVIFGGELAISTGASTYGHNSAADGFGVAAVDAAEAINGVFVGGPTTPVELFSSDGPRRIFYDRDNNPINPANPGVTFASRGGVTRAKPDLAAADGVVTTLPAGSGLNPFFGTSAAAPHAGAIAGLIKAAVPALTPARLRNAMLTGTIDIAQAGTDRNSGRGIVSAFSALSRAGARPAVTLSLGAVTVRPLEADVILPGDAAQLTVAIDNGGGAPATAVVAQLTSSSPDVLILQGVTPYPTLGAETTGGSGIIPYAFFVSPTTPCGTQLPFTLTVNFTGNGARPAVFNFVVQTGRPGSTSTRIAYTGAPVAIPDDDSVGVDVPFDVSGFAGPIASLKFNIDGTACSATAGSTTVGVDHTFVADLTFTLTAPGGRSSTLIAGAGGSGNNFCQTILDDTAAASIQTVLSGQAPFTGSFKPAQPNAAFTGADPNGRWTLHVADEFFLDSGSVRAFSIDVSGFSCSR
jgi:subtilisin-like proprotein convertase family protein